MDADSIIGAIFSFENYGELLVLVQNSLWAGAVLGLLGGLVGTFVMKRDLAHTVEIFGLCPDCTALRAASKL